MCVMLLKRWKVRKQSNSRLLLQRIFGLTWRMRYVLDLNAVMECRLASLPFASVSAYDE